jgi:hypothetical protein
MMSDLSCWICSEYESCPFPVCSEPEAGEQGELFDDTMQSVQLRESGEMQS